MFKNVLIPIDRSAVSIKAAKAGIALAKRLGASVTIYTGVERLQRYYGDEGIAASPAAYKTVQKRAREQAQRGYEIARAQYREGISSPLELTDAEVALRQSEFNYAQAVYDYLAARARLDEALGVSADVQADGGVALTLETPHR